MKRECCRPCLKMLREATPRHHLTMDDQRKQLVDVKNYLEQQNKTAECANCILLQNIRTELFDLEAIMMQ